MLAGQAGRDINEEIFAHENGELPLTLSSQGQMHKGAKSKIVNCLESKISVITASPTVDFIIPDGAFIVQTLRHGTDSTFDEYTDYVILPYILSCLGSVSRFDVVWDIYKSDSLKYTAREKRDGGIR
ncbi:hypothetical protein PoB_001130400 [Plakobranchus ocellatus]|uniref:Uncharacterized protein n=1 Tax=Plakobranchus ocellatus TaxID=259542 RepID=A0AAV3YRX6_9GAST|nr:hypothetical protein PoB_001130400 [Plakobranchus ocellatus]